MATPWTTPRTWAAAETVTAALLNTHLRDDLKHVVNMPAVALTGEAEQPTGITSDVVFDTAIWNDWGVWSAGDPGLLTIPEAGFWVVEFRAVFGVSPDGTREVFGALNGGPLTSFGSCPAVAGRVAHCVGIGFQSFDAGDTFSFGIAQDCGGPLHVDLFANAFQVARVP